MRNSGGQDIGLEDVFPPEPIADDAALSHEAEGDPEEEMHTAAEAWYAQNVADVDLDRDVLDVDEDELEVTP